MYDSLLKNLQKKWNMASRMRTWLVEKRKDIDDVHEKNKQQAQAAMAFQQKLQKQKTENLVLFIILATFTPKKRTGKAPQKEAKKALKGRIKARAEDRKCAFLPRASFQP